MPPKRSQSTKFQNFHFFERPLCPNALRQRFRTDFILHPTGLASERPYQFKGSPLNFGPLGSPPPKKFFQNFSKILEVGASFSSALYGDPQGLSGIKFRQLYLSLLPQKKILKFRRKSTIFRVTRKSEAKKGCSYACLSPVYVVQSTPPGFDRRENYGQKTDFPGLSQCISGKV